MTIGMRTWRVGLEQAYRMYSHRWHTDSSTCHANPSASLTGGPGFNTQPSRQGSTPMEDSLFEINQTGLSPMWYDGHPSSFHTRSSSLLRRDPSPAYIDPRVGRPAMQARPPLPFQYVTEPPSVPMHANTAPPAWETPPVDVRFRGRGRAPNTARCVR